jgi:methionine synthase I (cobalamin-dependent)
MPYELSRRLGAGPLLCDGAMGTLLYARGVSLDACFDVLNLNNPRVVQSIHADYIAAGADCIETNTFGANRFKLAIHGLEGQVREVNRRGVALARDVRESSGQDVFVLGSIGPLGKYLAPLGTVTPDEALAAFREQAEALLEGGVDGFIVETFSDLEEVALAVAAIRAITDVPIRWRSPTTASRSRADQRPRSRAPCGVFRFRPSGQTARSARALSTRCWSRCTPRPGGCPCVSSPTPACRAGSGSA